MSAHGDVIDCPCLLKQGTKAFLFRRLSDAAPLEALNSALGAN